MSKNTSSADLVAAFLAKGGKVAKVAADASSGITARQFYLASKGDISLKPKSENDLIEERHVVCGGVQNGLGEWISNDRLG